MVGWRGKWGVDKGGARRCEREGLACLDWSEAFEGRKGYLCGGSSGYIGDVWILIVFECEFGGVAFPYFCLM